MPDASAQYLCASSALHDGGKAVGFEVYIHAGEHSGPARAFAVRYAGQVYAYVNRCSHVPMELDWQENQVFDDTGHWLVCASHGAVYAPESGACRGGPCRGSLQAIPLVEENQQVFWLTTTGIQVLRQTTSQ